MSQLSFGEDVRFPREDWRCLPPPPKDRCVVVLPMLDGLVTTLPAFGLGGCFPPVGLMPSVVPRNGATRTVDCRCTGEVSLSPRERAPCLTERHHPGYARAGVKRHTRGRGGCPRHNGHPQPPT